MYTTQCHMGLCIDLPACVGVWHIVRGAGSDRGIQVGSQGKCVGVGVCAGEGRCHMEMCRW